MIRIIHNLGGCGGTLLSRCLGVLPGVALLSEINPQSVYLYDHFHPLYQDHKWLHLLGAADHERFAAVDLRQPSHFRELIKAFYGRCRMTGRKLILRDYNFIEFVGVPFTDRPARKRLLCETLPEGVPIASIVFVRHPVHQWGSLCKHAQVRGALSPGAFVEAYEAFLDDVGSAQKFRYEDFVRDPGAVMQSICAALELDFDPEFTTRFHGFDHVTGDFERQTDKEIALPAARHISEEVMEEFRSTRAFRNILERIGYLDDRGAATLCNPGRPWFTCRAATKNDE